MRAVRCAEGNVAVVDVPTPEGDGVRVRIRSAGICGSDLHLVDGSFPIPVTLGHELAGEAPDGTPVAVEPLAPCGHCEFCVRGDYNLCVIGPGMVFGTGRDGGMADEVLVPARALVPLPAGIEVRNACLIEPLAVCVHGLRNARLHGGLKTAVVGAGSIGLCAVAALRSSGAEVGLVARHDPQREAGARLGAVEARADRGYDLVIDAAGTVDSLAACVELCKPGGTLLLLATYWGGLELPGFALSLKEVRVLPSSMYGREGAIRDIEVAASLLAARPEIADVLISHRFPLDAATEAFATARDRTAGAIKVVLEP